MGQTLAGQDTVKYLGVSIDQTVSGETIAKNIIHKANSRLRFLYRQASCLNQNSRKILCSALIQFHFDYAASAWYSGLSQVLKKRLQTTQNKMVRFILNLGPRAHVDQELLSTLNFLTVENRVRFLKICHVHKIFNCNSVPYLAERFIKTSDFYRYNTRGVHTISLFLKLKALLIVPFTLLQLKSGTIFLTNSKVSLVWGVLKVQ